MSMRRARWYRDASYSNDRSPLGGHPDQLCRLRCGEQIELGLVLGRPSSRSKPTAWIWSMFSARLQKILRPAAPGHGAVAVPTDAMAGESGGAQGGALLRWAAARQAAPGLIRGPAAHRGRA